MRRLSRRRRLRWAIVAGGVIGALVLAELFAGLPFGPVYWFREFAVTPNLVPTDDAHVRMSAQIGSFSGPVGGIPVTFGWVNATGVRYPIATALTDAGGSVSVTHKPPSVGELKLVASFRVPGSSETVTSPVASLTVHLPPTL